MQPFDSDSPGTNRIRMGIGAVVLAGLLATACASDSDRETSGAAAPDSGTDAAATTRQSPPAPEPAPAPPPPADYTAPSPSRPQAVELTPPATPPQPAMMLSPPAAAAEPAPSRTLSEVRAATREAENALAEAQAAAEEAMEAAAAAQAEPAAARQSRSVAEAQAAEQAASSRRVDPLEPEWPGQCWGCSVNIFEDYGVNPFVDTYEDPLSTFALDVDTASYVVTRNHLQGGVLPPMEAVRVEEFVNYFDGGYPTEWDEFAIDMEAAPSPFSPNGYVLLRVGVQAPDVLADVVIPDSVIVVMDRSGSMEETAGYAGEYLERIELAREAVELLLEGLPDGTRVGIVSYDDRVETVVEPTDVGGNRDWIMRQVRENVWPRGNTNAGAGLESGYDMALEEARRGREVLVMLLSDGVANVGATRTDDILADIGDRAEIGLSTIGVGLGPFNDVLMEQLANSADGTYHYIDSKHEARRVFGSNIVSLLALAARDAKVQVEFNPEVVWSYRLLGFENRDVADEDFRDNTVDAGEVGLGQSSTALYEVELAGRSRDRDDRATLATVTLRYQRPRRGSITEIEQSLTGADITRSFASASPHFRLAAVAAEFAEVLRHSPFVERRDLDMEVLSEEAWYAADDLRRDADAEELARLIDMARREAR